MPLARRPVTGRRAGRPVPAPPRACGRGAGACRDGLPCGARPRAGRSYSAASGTERFGSTARIAFTSSAIIASVWKGVAQSRNRSVPRGTVG